METLKHPRQDHRGRAAKTARFRQQDLDSCNFQIMYPTGNLLIPVVHGQLEAIIKEPRNDALSGVALVLHPHPLGGGTMHNKVVFRAAAALNDAGLLTLRINFRGVGKSTGAHDEGRGELDDVRAGLQYLEENYPGLTVTLCGFSFGARVGLEVGINDDRVRNLISIGTPVNKYEFTFLESCRKPILFVHGDADEFGEVSRLLALVAQIRKHNSSVDVKVIKGADHFFKGHLEELKQAITDWIRTQTEAS
ncbi:MAG TPA: alpha/beta fold hydrolase [Pyrinomonadaceae bacterium]